MEFKVPSIPMLRLTPSTIDPVGINRNQSTSSTRSYPKLTLTDFDAINVNGFDPQNITAEPPKPWSEWTLEDDFDIGKPLGEGLLGHVYLARTKKEKFMVALKVIHAEQIDDLKQHQTVTRETEIHANLDHENIIKMYGYFRDEDKIVYVLEYAAGGEVFAELTAEPLKRFDDQRAATYVYQITLALEYLHSKGVLHRDIKPENLLIGSYGEIKMADFGWSVQVKTQEKYSRKSICGTPDYLPPEMILMKGYNEKIDVWCLGVLIYEFLVGSAPFYSENHKDTQDKITSGNYTIPDFVNEDAKDLIRKILVLDPNKRISLSQVRSHPWCEKNRSVEKKLLPIFDEFDHLLPQMDERCQKVVDKLMSSQA